MIEMLKGNKTALPGASGNSVFAIVKGPAGYGLKAFQIAKQASVPSVRCSRGSSSDSGCFSIDLFLLKPLCPAGFSGSHLNRLIFLPGIIR